MRQAVLDASVVLKWFPSAETRHVAEAHSLRAAFEAGELGVLAPVLLRLEVLNVVARNWRWKDVDVLDLAAQFSDLGFTYVEPELRHVAGWTIAGLSAYDAAYVALAEIESLPLVTDDRAILAAAPSIAVPLAAE